MTCPTPVGNPADGRRVQSSMGIPAALAAGLLTLALAGCGTATVPATSPGTSPTGTPASPSPEPDRGELEHDGPPPVTVRSATGSVDLEAYTYCFGSTCADGVAPSDPPDVGSPDEVFVEIPLDGWSLEASFSPVGKERCPRGQTVQPSPDGDGSFVLRPAGYAGTYDVTLFARGDGDLVTVFRWTTPSDGPLPTPRARLAVLADNDGGVDSYGVELSLSDMAATPEVARATVTVTAAEGKALSFDAVRSRGCQPEGSVFWGGPDGQGRAAAELGRPPFTYDVTMVLDGQRHTATARWPEDEIRGNEPSVALRFDPPLPALQ